MRSSLPLRAVSWLKRIALALERAYPPPPARPQRRAEFSIATAADFEAGYDARLAESDGVPAERR